MNDHLQQALIEPWTDAPLRNPKDDLLGRQPFLSMVADLLKNLTNSNDSSVVALTGPWGSGKSTLLNFLRPALRPQVKVVTFSPWSAEGSTEIQREFFASFLEAFPKGSHRKVRKNVKTIMRRSSPLLKSVPWGLGNGVAELVKETLPEESWDSAFQRLSDAINEAGSRVLVIIDDIDRLQPDEIMTLMKMVRLTGRFPRTNYLLSYDHNSLVEILAAGLRGKTETANAFLEKIVQYPLSLPPAQQTHLQRIVFDEVRSILTDTTSPFTLSPFQRFQAFYTDHMWDHLTTPRACRRYCAQAKTYLALAENEVDPADFLAITFLRLHHPRIYAQIPKWRGRLIGMKKVVAPVQDRPKAQAEWDELISESGYTSKTEILALGRAISDLFPRMAGELGRSADSSGKFRACDPAYFDRYFTFSLPFGDISDQLILTQIDSLSKGVTPAGQPLIDTFDHPNIDIRMLAVQKGNLHSDWSSAVPNMNLVKFVARSLARDPVQFDLPISPGMQKVGWLARLLDANLENHGEHVSFIVDSFGGSSWLVGK
ncbi:KAP family P-loop NTPase fold protein [Arthrobacter sp. KNU40]|uniref:KAP family P-loop NTPase fold protein n=1 Tax=Arthrobacter sp. KNU40 TaxID=3447965 RepID=UPI003F631168